MSAFIRKMVLNGYMIIPEWPELKGVLSLHSRISNNLNQYAKKANETGKRYVFNRSITIAPVRSVLLSSSCQNVW